MDERPRIARLSIVGAKGDMKSIVGACRPCTGNQTAPKAVQPSPSSTVLESSKTFSALRSAPVEHPSQDKGVCDPLADMQRALGSPLGLVTVPVSKDEDAVIGRWKHDDAEARMPSGDGLIKIIVNLSNTQKVERLSHGIWTSKPFDICSLTIVPPDEDVRFSVTGQADVLQIFLPQNVALRDSGSAIRPPVRLRFQEHDALIERYALQLMQGVRNRRATEDMRLEELIAELGDHLTRDSAEEPSRAKGGLPPNRLGRVLDLISVSISGPQVAIPRLDQLASVAELSPFHFARAFRETVGLSPCAYVLRKRLERARAMLAKSLLSVSEIGSKTGFRSHAHFSSQFRQHMGISPIGFRRAVHPDYDMSAV